MQHSFHTRLATNVQESTSKAVSSQTFCYTCLVCCNESITQIEGYVYSLECMQLNSPSLTNPRSKSSLVITYYVHTCSFHPMMVFHFLAKNKNQFTNVHFFQGMHCTGTAYGFLLHSSELDISTKLDMSSWCLLKMFHCLGKFKQSCCNVGKFASSID